MILNMGNRIKDVNKRVQKLREERQKVQQVMILREQTKRLDGIDSANEELINTIDGLNTLTDGFLKELGIESFQPETLEALEDGQYPLEAWTTEKVGDDWQVIPDESKVLKMNETVAKFGRQRDKTRKDGRTTIEQEILRGRWNGNE